MTLESDGSVAFNPALLDEFVAPGFSQINQALIPDLRIQFGDAPNWIINYFLNSVARGQYAPGFRQLVLGFLRRTSSAFTAYHMARDVTLELVQLQVAGSQPIRKYYAAVDAWEGFALQVSMALELYKSMNDGNAAFQSSDGSPEYRLHKIGNQIKHAPDYVNSGRHVQEDTLPLWLSNNGLESFGRSVTYAEAAAILTDMSNLAALVQDPLHQIPTINPT